MREVPRIAAERILLRAFVPADGPTVERLAGAREVADTTLALPHPYPLGAGVEWIATHADAWDRGERLTLAVCDRAAPDDLLGAIAIRISESHQHGEIGYWIGAANWGKGYATDAARALVAYAFAELHLHRIQARHFMRNRASGRVMQKLGMKLEGVHRDAYLRWGRFEDVAVYGILASEWSAGAAQLSQSPNQRVE